MMTDGLDSKLAALRARVRAAGGMVVAFSGGADSTLLAAVAVAELGERALAVTALSPTYPAHEQAEAARIAAQLGIRHETVISNELEIAGFAGNPPDRCYHCKHELFSVLGAVADREGLPVVADGSNADDVGDYRPGRRAAAQLQVWSPLLECGLTKEEVRAASRQLGLPTADKPAYACLASRFPYGQTITEAKLKAVDALETAVRAEGIRQVRVRHHGDVARIEVLPADIPRLTEPAVRARLVEAARAAGFSYLAADLQGYRTGSMNETLSPAVRRAAAGLAGAALLLLLAAGAGPAVAGPRLLTPDDCVRGALTNSTQMRIAGIDEREAAAQVREARGLALPHVTGSATYTRLDRVENVSFGEESFAMGTLDNYQVDGRVRQALYAGGRVRAALRAAGLAGARADQARRVAENGVELATRRVVHGVLFARAAVEVHKAAQEQIAALVTETAAKRAQGTASEYDMLAAQVRLANERPALIAAENELGNLREQLARLLNLPVDQWELGGALERVELAVDGLALEAQAVANHPAVLLRQTVAGLRETDVAATASLARPGLYAFAGETGANAYRFVAFDDDWQWHWNAGVALEWNFWDGGETRARVAQKQLARERAEEELDETVRDVRLAVRQAVRDLAHAREAVGASEGTVQLAERGLGIAKTRYDAGAGTYLEVMDANVSLRQARLARDAALRAHMDARAALAHACGTPALAGGTKEANHDEP